MANPEHLEILKQGVVVWNQWREEKPAIRPDLSKANLVGMNLTGANFIDVNLAETILSAAILHGVNLTKADLSGANLSWADLLGTNLRKANLQRANLDMANLTGTNLTGANLQKAKLSGTDFTGANLNEANFNNARVTRCNFGDNDLSSTKGLEKISYVGPSTVGIDTIYKSKGQIPESFLRGVGVPDTFIEYIKSLTGTAFEYYSCFISYSSKDHDFAERLYADLQSKGVRCWFAPEDMKVGDKIRQRIDQSIRIHDKLLLILSQNSIGSEWVEDEVEAAYDEERKQKKTVLFPIRIDDAVMDTDKAWAAKLRRSQHIGDFTRWKDHDVYQSAFERLLNDLKAEGKMAL